VNPSEDELAELLRTARRIAVVGLSPDPDRPSNSVTRYLQAAGFEIIPVNGKHAGEEILGVPVVAKVTDIPGRVDIVNLFRRSVDVPRSVDEAIAAGAGAIWMQLGIRNEDAAAKAKAAGLTVVMNRCIAVDHRRLVRD
jgi:hypothetical protein